MQAPAAWHDPPAVLRDHTGGSQDAQILSVEHEEDNSPRPEDIWRLEEPADELSMSLKKAPEAQWPEAYPMGIVHAGAHPSSHVSGTQWPTDAHAVGAMHDGAHHVSMCQTTEESWQEHAGGGRPGSASVWQRAESHNLSGAHAMGAAHAGCSHGSMGQGIADSGQLHAEGPSRQSSGSAWDRQHRESHGIICAHTSGLSFDACATEPGSGQRPHLIEKGQLPDEFTAAAYASAAIQPDLHADSMQYGGRGLHEPLHEINTYDEAEMVQGAVNSYEMAAAHAFAGDSHEVRLSAGSDVWASQEAVPAGFAVLGRPGTPRHMQGHAGSARLGMPFTSRHMQGQTGSTTAFDHSLPFAVCPASSTGQDSDFPQLGPARAASMPEGVGGSSGSVVGQAMLGVPGHYSAATQDLEPAALYDSTHHLSQGFNSSQACWDELAVASSQSLVPNQEEQGGNSSAALPCMLAPMLGQQGTLDTGLVILQSSTSDAPGISSLGCFSEQCDAAMQVFEGAADMAGIAAELSALPDMPDQAAGSSLQGVTDSQVVWSQLSAVYSEADSFLEAASGSCKGSTASHHSQNDQASCNSLPFSCEDSIQEANCTAASSGDVEAASCSNAQSTPYPDEASNNQARAGMQSDTVQTDRETEDEHRALSHEDMRQPVQPASPSAAGGYLAGSGLPVHGGQSNPCSSGTATHAWHFAVQPSRSMHACPCLHAMQMWCFAATVAIVGFNALERIVAKQTLASSLMIRMRGCFAGTLPQPVSHRGTEPGSGAAQRGDMGHLKIAAYHSNRSPQSAALNASTHLRSPLRTDLVCLN